MIFDHIAPDVSNSGISENTLQAILGERYYADFQIYAGPDVFLLGNTAAYPVELVKQYAIDMYLASCIEWIAAFRDRHAALDVSA